MFENNLKIEYFKSKLFFIRFQKIQCLGIFLNIKKMTLFVNVFNKVSYFRYRLDKT